MAVLKVTGRKMSRGGLSRYWRDDHGEARILGVIDGYAMMRRPGKAPFIVWVKDLINGKAGYRTDNPPPPLVDD